MGRFNPTHAIDLRLAGPKGLGDCSFGSNDGGRGASPAATRRPSPVPRRWPHAPRPSGFTLIEILVVITIVLMLLGATTVMMHTAGDARRVREAARAVNGYLASARNRAMEIGRPCGVIFRNFASPGFAMNADQCEVPPCFCGSDVTSMANVFINAGTYTATFVTSGGAGAGAESIGGSCSTMLWPGDLVQFNGQGPLYSITSGADGVDTTSGFLNSTSTLTLSLADTVTAPNVPWSTGNTLTVPYRMFPSPAKGAATPLQLPAGSVVDFGASGVGTTYVGSQDFTVLFSPTGSVYKIYYGNTGQDVTDTIYLLVGRRVRVGQSGVSSPSSDNESDWANWQDIANCYWVTVNPRTGAVGTEPVGPAAGGMPGDIGDSRGLAAQAVGMGGR